MIPYFAILLNPNGRFRTTGSPPGGVGRGRSAGQRKALAAGSAFGSGLTGVVKKDQKGDGGQETGVERNVQTYDHRSQMPLKSYSYAVPRLLSPRRCTASLRRSTCGQGNLTRPICRPSLMSP